MPHVIKSNNNYFYYDDPVNGRGWTVDPEIIHYFTDFESANLYRNAMITNLIDRELAQELIEAEIVQLEA